MKIKKRIVPNSKSGMPISSEREREYIFYKVRFNNFREVSGSSANEVLDREEWDECECVLLLPENYSDEGEPTQLIISCHGAGGHVCEATGEVGGVTNVTRCVDAGYAALDICGSHPDGRTMGCPEHVFALYKAYRYAIKHYNLSERVLIQGSSMGGHTAMNFANTFPSLVIAAALFYPRLNINGVEVDGHYCRGTWDKVEVVANGLNSRERIVKLYRFPSDEFCLDNTQGFNPYRSHSFVNGEGQRCVIPPCPVKIWQGTEDKTVDPAMVREYYESVRRSGSYAEMHLMEGVGHKSNPVMYEETLMWFNRFIGG